MNQTSRSRAFWIGILFWIGAWELLVVLFPTDSNLLPSLYSISRNTIHLLLAEDSSFSTDIAKSMTRFSLAALISLPLGFASAIAVSHFRPMSALIQPLVAVLYPTPKIALFPFLLLLLGIGDSSRVALISMGIFFLVYLSTLNGLSQLLKSSTMDLVRAYSIRGWNYWWYIVVRGALPQFLSGTRMGLGYGVTLVVVSESTMSRDGLGHHLWSAWEQFQIQNMYSCLLIIALIGCGLHVLLSYLEERVSPNQ